jgi:HEAT repeat protein
LLEFLSSPRELADPVERLGEDAVINAAARWLAYRSDPGLFDLLLELAQRPCLTGVIFALGASRNAKAIPRLIQALGEDVSRMTAEIALKRMGSAGRSALLQAAMRTTPLGTNESESTVRQRCSAIRLLAEMGVSNRTWSALRHLMQDHDPRIALPACTLCLSCGSTSERRDAVRRLIRLSASVDWVLHDEIERHLIAYLYVARDAMPDSDELENLKAENETIKDFIQRILQHIPRTP